MTIGMTPAAFLAASTPALLTAPLAAQEAATDDAMTASATDMMASDGMAPGEVAEGAQSTPEMQAVLDKLVGHGADPIGILPPAEQRQEPTPADAVMALMQERGIAPDPALAAITARDVTYPAGDGSSLPARVYTPPGEGPFPLVIYFHGGGWVIADVDTYDASARALAAGGQAVVEFERQAVLP